MAELKGWERVVGGCAVSNAAIDPMARLGLAIAILLVVAKLGSELATRFGQSAVLGELVAGIVLGNLPVAFLAEIKTDPYVDMLARLGIMVLLFEVGLASTVREVARVGGAAAAVALLGTIGSLAFGVGAMFVAVPHGAAQTRWFVAAAITATSIGISARVLRDMGAAASREAHTILGAAVLDDVLGLVVLALLTGLTRNSGRGSHAAIHLALWIFETLAFLGVSTFLGVVLSPYLFSFVARLKTPQALLAAGLSFCFVFAWGASAIGLSPIVGAFTAGLVLEELHSAQFVARGEPSLAARMEPISAWLVPLFFVLVGMRADVGALAHPSTLGLVAALALAAFVGKLACALGVPRNTDRLTVAMGMLPRGEVTLVFANLGTTGDGGPPLLGAAQYSALVAVVILTTVVTPLLLRRRLESIGRGRSAA